MKERLVGAAVLMAAAVILIPEMLSGPSRDLPPKQAGAEAGPIKTYTIDLTQPPTAPPAVVAEQTDRAPPPEELAGTTTAGDASPTAEASPLADPQTAPEIEAQPPKPADAERSPAKTAREVPSTVESSSQSAASQATRAETAPAKAATQPSRTETPAPKAETQPRPQTASQAVRNEAPTASKAEGAPTRSIASAPSDPTSQASAVKSGWAVQLGSYSSEATAERLRNEWRAKGLNAFVMPVKAGGKTLYRVRIGPAKDRAAADAVLKAVKPSNPAAAVVAHP